MRATMNDERRRKMIRQAAEMPKGSPERRRLLAILSRRAYFDVSFAKQKAREFGRSLAGRPDIAIAVKEALEKKRARDLADELWSAYKRGQADMDLTYDDY